MMHRNRNRPDEQGPPSGSPGASRKGGEQDGAGPNDGGHADEALEQTAALVQSLTAEREDALEKWKRALADFQNYQRRALENEREARRQGATSVLQSIIPVLDHF